MNPKQNPMAGALPVQSNTASPALTGQPQSVTGGVGTGQIPPQAGGQMSPQAGGAALAPASPQGSADVGAPLSNGAPSQKAGAGADLDLVKDRGKPTEYWNNNISKLGSKKSLQLLGDAAKGSSGKTGKLAEQDPEEVRRMGAKMNDGFGIGDRESQDKAVEGIVFEPMSKIIKDEVSKGVMTEDEGVMRLFMTMAQVRGVENDEELVDLLAEARSRIGEK